MNIQDLAVKEAVVNMLKRYTAGITILEKTKCLLIGSNRKLESKVSLTVSIVDHKVENVRSFKYLGIIISTDFTWTEHVEHC